MSYLKKVEAQRKLMVAKMKSNVSPDVKQKLAAKTAGKKYRDREGIVEYKPLGEGEKSGLRKVWDEMTSHLKKEKPKKIETTPKA